MNNHTTLFVAAALYFILPLNVLWILWTHRSASIYYWCLGSLCACFGILFLGFRTHLPIAITFHIANTLILCSFVLWAQSIKYLLKSPWPHSIVLAMVALAFVYYSASYLLLEPFTRGLAVRLALGVLAIYVAWLALQIYQQSKSHNALIIGAAYTITGIALLTFLFAGGPSSQPSPFSNTWNASFLAITALLMAAAGHFSYVGMILDDTKLEQTQKKTEAYVISHFQQLKKKMASLETQHRLRLVAGSLAHELNQPLTVILTHSQIISRALATQKVQAETLSVMLDKIAHNIHRVSSILDRIRNIHRSDPDPMTTIAINDCIVIAIEQLQDMVEKYQVRVEWIPQKPSPDALGDSVQISQVLVNLCRNAIQAMRESETRVLKIHTSTSASSTTLVVSDTGPGIPFNPIEKLKEAFHQSSRQGLGMGLIISQMIIERHQGRMRFANHEGRGLSVSIEIPRQREPS
jgi:signal transduction histidine kinase